MKMILLILWHIYGKIDIMERNKYMKRLLCKIALNIMLKEKDKIGLTNKQKSQVEALLVKVDRL